MQENPRPGVAEILGFSDQFLYCRLRQSAPFLAQTKAEVSRKRREEGEETVASVKSFSMDSKMASLDLLPITICGVRAAARFIPETPVSEGSCIAIGQFVPFHDMMMGLSWECMTHFVRGRTTSISRIRVLAAITVKLGRCTATPHTRGRPKLTNRVK